MEKKNEIQVKNNELTPAVRFTNAIMKEYNELTDGKLELSKYRQELAKRMFISIDRAIEDACLREQEKKDRKDAKSKYATPEIYSWKNVNMKKLAVDATRRVSLDLDANTPNHIWPVIYKNTRKNQIDVDLRIGYKGKEYYKRNLSYNPLKDIIYELVHENDEFIPLKKDKNNDIESYNFNIKEPFERGKVVGAFGYLSYEDDTLNKLKIVPMSEFDKIKKEVKTDKFWGKWEDRMQLKTLVHRTTDDIIIDPKKTFESNLMNAIESEERKQLFDTPIQGTPKVEISATTFNKDNVVSEPKELVKEEPKGEPKPQEETKEVPIKEGKDGQRSLGF